MEQTALIYVMVLMSAADGTMSDRELFTMHELVRILPVFKGYNPDKLPQTANDCAELLKGAKGADGVIAQVVQWLPDRLHETAYSLACDIAAAEGRLRQEEIKLLEFLRQSLKIGRLPAAAIERAAKARWQTL